MEKELVGFDIQDPKIDVVAGNVVGSAKAVHVGKIGKVSLTLEGELSAKPILFKLVDIIEKAIPGDQTGIAGMAKAAIDKALN